MSGRLWRMGFLWVVQGLHPRQEQKAGAALEKSRLLPSLKGASLEWPSSKRMEKTWPFRVGSLSLQAVHRKESTDFERRQAVCVNPGFTIYYTVLKVKVAQSCIQSMEFSGQNTGVGSLSLLQGIFPTQGLNPGPLHCRQILYQLSYQGSRTWSWER